MVDETKRSFLKRFLRDQLAGVVAGFREGMQAGDRKAAFDRYFGSYESSYALTLAYPDDILLETASRHGIAVEGREKADIIKELFQKQGGDEYRF